MSNYQKQKEKVRQIAIAWQINCAEKNYSYGELINCQNFFEKLAQRYGLLTEFRENGII